ncbi:sensor histidine kinase [Nocardioides ungokensis]|uniref:sensor histidine kinase n=1 Tax=Nocardioides ungokensis TaxID=1643322 RepID=UPI0015DFC7F2|nr:sensor histidine kinase [Nocardioides ungokensis]
MPRSLLRWTLATPSPAGGAPTWRLTTAVRVFGLALLMGQVLDDGSLSAGVIVLMALAVVGTTCCACELHASRSTVPWIAVTEGLMVGVLVSTATGPVEPLLPYLAVPAVVAGISGGFAPTMNSWLTTVLAFTAADAAGLTPGATADRVGAALPWLFIGLGSGLLCAQRTRSLRRLEARQAPYFAAHRLVGQLHDLVRDLPGELDVTRQVGAIREAVHRALQVEPTVVVQGKGRRFETLSTRERLSASEEEVARLCTFYGQRVQRDDITAFPLRVGQHAFGAIVLGHWTPPSKQLADAVQQLLDEHAVALETALLVEDIRAIATNEERNRLARDIHDGVAQRIAALGYLVDDVSELTERPETTAAAEALRDEITELVRELRLSVLDLRHEVDGSDDLSGALSEYVRQLSAHSDLRVHLMLDEQSAQLSRRVTTEVLRVAQEAIGNVHKHAHAVNVWVRFSASGSNFRLAVEDDGVGAPTPRPGHYGLHTMRERAARIGATLDITPRHDGGTVVSLQSPQSTCPEGTHDAHQRLARR